MKNYNVTIPEDVHKQLCLHLIRKDSQEDLCFATYNPSSGNTRVTGIIRSIIEPIPGDREVHGNVSFVAAYFERAMQIARERKEGLAFLHSHTGPGWQDMSRDDIIAEKRLAPSVMAATGLPLLGMTIGTDQAWSARFWIREISKKRSYIRMWCETVKVIGKKLTATFNDNILKPNFDSQKQLRTISAWGIKNQENLSRLKIGIVGLGSVGSIVAEVLARTGVSYFTLIDFDSVEEKNLDRLTNIFKKDIGRAKAEAVKEGILRSATSPNVNITTVEYSICEKGGYMAALDCDVLFSCVDRPWPRQVLNFIAYAHLIPVIDGGILVRTNRQNTNIIGADWKAQTVGYKRACLECVGQYKTENAVLEKDGFLDDPNYIKGLKDATIVNAHENVFVFSSHLASMEVLQLLILIFGPGGVTDVGQQFYHFTVGLMEKHTDKTCTANCFFPGLTGKGDNSGITVYTTIHQAAEKERMTRKKRYAIKRLNVLKIITPYIYKQFNKLLKSV